MVNHQHGAGKRWEGDRYTCSDERGAPHLSFEYVCARCALVNELRYAVDGSFLCRSCGSTTWSVRRRYSDRGTSAFAVEQITSPR